MYAYRVGKKGTSDSPFCCHMVAKVTLQLKEKIMSFAKNLKDVTDPVSGAKCFVSVNEPEAYKAARKKYKSMMDRIIEENKTRRPTQRIKARLMGKKFLVNGRPFLEVIHHHPPSEVVEAFERHETWLDQISFVESDAHLVQGNVFKGFAIGLQTSCSSSCILQASWFDP